MAVITKGQWRGIKTPSLTSDLINKIIVLCEQQFLIRKNEGTDPTIQIEAFSESDQHHLELEALINEVCNDQIKREKVFNEKETTINQLIDRYIAQALGKES